MSLLVGLRKRFFTTRFNRSGPLQRALHHRAIKVSTEGTVLTELKNNITARQTVSSYNDDSWNDLVTNLLVKNQLYIYVDKARLKKARLFPGHIFTFLTDNHGIIKDSCVSLRNGRMVENKALLFRLWNNPQQERRQAVYRVRFNQVKEEFYDFFLKRAEPSLAVEQDHARYLAGLSLENYNVDLLLEKIKGVLATYLDKEYILHSGRVNGESVRALNCITGFYEGLSVIGTEPDPSPQMALWSYLMFIWGPSSRDRFIEGTDLKVDQNERTHDDVLSTTVGTANLHKKVIGVTKPNYSNKRHFSTLAQRDKKTSIWDTFSEEEKIQCGIVTDYPETSEVAYYKGLGFKDLGLQYAGYAIAAFRDAIDLSPVESIDVVQKCQQQINEIRDSLHRENLKRSELGFRHPELNEYLEQEYQSLIKDLEVQHQQQLQRVKRWRQRVQKYVETHGSNGRP